MADAPEASKVRRTEAECAFSASEDFRKAAHYAFDAKAISHSTYIKFCKATDVMMEASVKMAERAMAVAERELTRHRMADLRREKRAGRAKQ